MKVWIKSFEVEMRVKQKGIEFEVRTADGAGQLGDCYLTMVGLTWCKGETPKENGVKVKWEELMDLCKSKETLKAAIKAAREKGEE